MQDVDENQAESQNENHDENQAEQQVVLDKAALTALKKVSVDVFNGNYLGEVENNALILVTDVRNFSTFLRENDENAVFSLIKEFTSNFLSCLNQIGANCSYFKLEGDGSIVIWDNADEDCINSALGVFREFMNFLNEYLFADSPTLGLAGALVLEKVFKYEISAEAPGLMYRDYVGYGINLACRLQNLAGKNELVINHRLIQDRNIPFSVKTGNDAAHQLSMLKVISPKMNASDLVACTN
ncbi:MAG: adenylate/guanylate cyclase domain-containing protein [Treponemataceae bacterium]|nr:MAG: adenylate/guanylate cyclase domain-containing protein [Treponemataceae bacterium]